MTTGLDGIDKQRVTDWLVVRTEVTPPLAFDRIEGGRSNLTYRLTDSHGNRWVLRRPPLYSVLASAHDVGREFQIMAALRDTPVPVPGLVGFEPDADVTGAPFYVMEFVDGVVPRDAETVAGALDWDARRKVAFNLADTLAELHAIDADAIGLGKLGKHTDYVARQLRRWSRQYEAGSERDLPLVRHVRDRLGAAIPDQGSPAIVHGDYRLDNMIVGEDGSIRAVLDWELCTLGDPMADVGLLHVYWSPLANRERPLIPAAGLIDGIPPIKDVIARYGQQSGRDLSRLDFYVAFGYWKLAVILEGVYTRFRSGAYGQGDGSHEAYGEMVIDLLQLAAIAVEGTDQ